MRTRLAEEGRAVGPEVEDMAKIIGIGAVKYADLSLNRESNYRFSYQKMLALNGNTAPYMLYAYARIQGIRRRASEAIELEPGQPVSVVHPAEVALAKQLVRLPEVPSEAQVPAARPAAVFYPSVSRPCPCTGGGKGGSRAVPARALRLPVRIEPEVQSILRTMLRDQRGHGGRAQGPRRPLRSDRRCHQNHSRAA